MVSIIPLQNDGAGIAEEIPALHPATSKDEEVYPTVTLSRGDDVVVDQHAGRTLSEDVLEMILTRLPFSVRCRLQWVCHKWKEDLLSLPYRITIATTPPCLIWSRLRNGNARFFCHSDEQWFTLPSTAFTIPLSNLHPSSGKSWKTIQSPPYESWSRLTVNECVFTIPSNVNESSESSWRRSWELVDIDAGFLCYRRNIEGSFWLCVSNPLTSFSRVIPPDYYHKRFRSDPYMLKLLVDREEKTFKVILVLDDPMYTAVYDSTTSSWLLCFDHPDDFTSDLYDYDSPGIHPTEMFVRKNVVYTYSTVRDDLFGNLVRAFNMELGSWTCLRAQFPRENKSKMIKYFVLTDRDEVLLVQFRSGRRSSFSVWKLLDDVPDPMPSPFDAGPGPAMANWEKVVVGSRRSMRRTRGISLPGELGHVCYGGGSIFFMFRGKEDKTDGSRTHTCLKYSIAAKNWDVVPCPTGWGEPFKLYHWEPSLDMNLS